MISTDQRRREADQIIESYLPEESGYDRALLEAMDYSVRVGGKRLRPILIFTMGRIYGAPEKLLHPFMAALEMIHTYSLVHDDLPAMDNDMLRRGNPTTHAKYGEAMAILAGDGLLSEAFAIITRTVYEEAGSEYAGNVARAAYILADKAGINGMVGGQSLDVESDKADRGLSTDELDYIYENKTSALIEAAMMTGATIGGASDTDLVSVERAGSLIGRAFQIRDDILDMTGDEALLGKETGQDERNGKKTYAALHGIEDSEAEVKRCTDEAVAVLKSLFAKRDGNASEEEFLLSLLEGLTGRKN